jgi:hypothetical protein
MKMKTTKIYKHKYSLKHIGIGMLGVGIILGSDIMLDKIINLFIKYFGWVYPSFALQFICAYDLTLVLIFCTSILFIVYGTNGGGKK